MHWICPTTHWSSRTSTARASCPTCSHARGALDGRAPYTEAKTLTAVNDRIRESIHFFSAPGGTDPATLPVPGITHVLVATGESFALGTSTPVLDRRRGARPAPRPAAGRPRPGVPVLRGGAVAGQTRRRTGSSQQHSRPHRQMSVVARSTAPAPGAQRYGRWLRIHRTHRRLTGRREGACARPGTAGIEPERADLFVACVSGLDRRPGRRNEDHGVAPGWSRPHVESPDASRRPADGIRGAGRAGAPWCSRTRSRYLDAVRQCAAANGACGPVCDAYRADGRRSWRPPRVTVRCGAVRGPSAVRRARRTQSREQARTLGPGMRIRSR